MSRFLFYIETAYRNNLFKIKGSILRLYFLSHGCKVGKKLRCHTFPHFRVPPYKNYFIGDNVTLGYNLTFEVLDKGNLFIGNFVKLTQNILISSGSQIKIGEFSLFAENVSIRDGDHKSLSNRPIIFQENKYSEINIGKDVWIGAGSLILPGAIIPDGVIIGANSIVLGKSNLKSYSIYAGSPVKYIKDRKT